MRPRLRFHLQELDLPLGATVIGRDAECHVTLDDPLVSRRHARILVGSDRVILEDLGSRNGVFVNGLCVRGPTPLRDADRVRIGAHQLLYCEAEGGLPSMPSRPTAELGLCTGCRLPYPRELAACPGCEGTDQVDEDTLVEPLKPKEAPRAAQVQRSAATEPEDACVLVDRATDGTGRTTNMNMASTRDPTLPPEPDGTDEAPTRRIVSFSFGDDVLAVVSVPLAAPSSLAKLTPVERHVASLAATGMRNAEIGNRRGTSERTVANQMASILRKLKVGSRYHLAAHLALCDLEKEHS